MGNRDDLLAGAKRCLRNKGYARTTARDIASESGVSLAAIGYHFGSKEALLNAALTEASGTELGDEFNHAVSLSQNASSSLERFETIWQHLIDSFPRHRALLTASMENLGQLEHVPEVRQTLSWGQRDAIAGMAEAFQAMDDTVDEQTAHAMGALHYTLMNGLIMLWLVDPESTPSGRELAEALKGATGTHQGNVV